MNLKKTISTQILFLSVNLAPLLANDAPAGAKSPLASLVGFAPMLAIFAIMYFLLIRPQQKTHRERQKMIDNVKRGDKILTSGGLYGTIVNIRGDILDLKVAENLKVELNRSFVSRVLSGSVTNPAVSDQQPVIVKSA